MRCYKKEDGYPPLSRNNSERAKEAQLENPLRQTHSSFVSKDSFWLELMADHEDGG